MTIAAKRRGRSGRRAPGRVVLGGLLLLAGCSSGEVSGVLLQAPQEPVGVQTNRVESFRLATTDHFVQTDSGGYICVLRRPDDLAELRASFGS